MNDLQKSLVYKCLATGKPGPCAEGGREEPRREAAPIPSKLTEGKPKPGSEFGKPYKGPRNANGIPTGNTPEAAGQRHGEAIARLSRRLKFSDGDTDKLATWARDVASSVYAKYDTPEDAEKAVGEKMAKIIEQMNAKAPK